MSDSICKLCGKAYESLPFESDNTIGKCNDCAYKQPTLSPATDVDEVVSQCAEDCYDFVKREVHAPIERIEARIKQIEALKQTKG